MSYLNQNQKSTFKKLLLSTALISSVVCTSTVSFGCGVWKKDENESKGGNTIKAKPQPVQQTKVQQGEDGAQIKELSRQADKHYYGNEVPKNWHQALGLYKDLDERYDDPQAQYMIGEIHRLGKQHFDGTKAQAYYVKAAQGGHNEAKLRLANIADEERQKLLDAKQKIIDNGMWRSLHRDTSWEKYAQDIFVKYGDIENVSLGKGIKHTDIETVKVDDVSLIAHITVEDVNVPIRKVSYRNTTGPDKLAVEQFTDYGVFPRKLTIGFGWSQDENSIFYSPSYSKELTHRLYQIGDPYAHLVRGNALPPAQFENGAVCDANGQVKKK